MSSTEARQKAPAFDHSSDPAFLAYYEEASLSEGTLQRFRTIKDKALALLSTRGRDVKNLRIADIGCGAGTQSMLWAEDGHAVTALDVNAPLIEVARRRTAERSMSIDFRVGTATALPFADSAFDVCLLPELLEHVVDWQSCLREAARVIDEGGLLYVSTTNVLCPVQEEFNLPGYSWYPGFIKRYYERLSVTTRPALANHAKYPAVHWFSFYELRDFLAPLGFESLDRFDMINVDVMDASRKAIVELARAMPPARLLGHMMTPGTAIFALKTKRLASVQGRRRG